MEWPQRIIPSLRRWGVLRTRVVEDALQELDWHTLLPKQPGRAGFLFAPQRRPDGTFDLSLRLSVLLTEILEVGPGTRVALPVPRPHYLEALVRAMGGRVHDPLRGETERSVEVSPAPARIPMADGGFRLRLNLGPHEESLTKIIHGHEAEARLGLEKLPLNPGAEPMRPIKQLLVVEGFCRRALEDRPRTAQDEIFHQAVESAWDPAAARAPGIDEQARVCLAAARRWFHLAYIHQFSADLGDAMELYRASIDSYKTSEAFTFLGWTLGSAGDHRAAIQECEKAIAVDPSFGNPYNDIGAYLLELGQPAPAVPWLERALRAPRYDAPHFALTNLGRALLALGKVGEARQHLRKAVEVAPGYRPAQEILKRLPPGA